MKNKRSNKQLYQDTFDQIKLSDEGYRQIRNMEESARIPFDKQAKRRRGFRIAISLAALAVVFLLANGVSYTDAGSSLIDQLAEHITVYIDGESDDDVKIETAKSTDKNGNTIYELILNSQKLGYSTGIIMDKACAENPNFSIDDGKHVVTITSEDSDNDTSSSPDKKFRTSLRQGPDATYLVIEGISQEAVQVDITQDYADGNAEGTVQIKNTEYQYKVRGTGEIYTIDFEKR